MGLSKIQSPNLTKSAHHGFAFEKVENHEHEFLGMCGLSVPGYQTAFSPCVEIGWRFAREHWGRGYAAEAAAAWLSHGFETLRLEEIVSFAPALNIRSQAVMQRIGMVRDAGGDFAHPLIDAGHPLSVHVLYRLRRQDFRP